ncbi:MAG: HAD family hydrolase [Candidatus Amulumruptor caecigallinarius]|nr:HAD family hydrolase [Candidatus Amulumruptor caecigallinarius]
MKTLYVSDLDGTLLQPDSRLSARSVEMLNTAIAQGINLTVATARTPATVHPILSDVNLRLPAIVMTGAAMWSRQTHEYSRTRHIAEKAARQLVDVYRDTQTPTFIYTLDDNMIDIYFLGEKMNDIQQKFIEERINNPFKRLHTDPHTGIENIDFSKVILLYTMLDDCRASAVYRQICRLEDIRPQYYHDIFGPEVGILEAFSSEATKAKAVLGMAEKIGADRIVCFGDNINDLPMMQVADLAVAVENAIPEVKEKADIVIGPNTDDSVAGFILDHR